MNQAQRKFLIDRIEAKTKAKIEEISRSETLQPPSLENYFYGLALTGQLQIQSTEHIKKVICERAMAHTSKSYSETWLGTNQGDLIDKAKVRLKIRDLFVVPSDYDEMWEAYRKSREEKEEQIRVLRMECDSITTRIQLASDKTLDRMIAEIDDMGDISLMDNTLKTLLMDGIKQNSLP